MPAVREKFKNLDLESNSSIVTIAHRGVKANVFYRFAQLANMTDKALAAVLHLHPRTIKNYLVHKKSLNPVESEHLLKIIALYKKGEELFGNINEFNVWLGKPSWDNKFTPQRLLISPGGVDLVAAELERLAQGYVA